MDSIFKYQIRVAIEQLKKNNFQDFIDELFSLYYGQANYLSTRQYRDKGCDGIIKNSEIINVYAPEKIELSAFKTKISDDYQLYLDNWKETYPVYHFILNGEYTGEMIEFCNKLDVNINKWNADRILKVIEQFSWLNIRAIGTYLHIDEQYFIYDILKCVIDDLLKDEKDKSVSNKTLPPDIIKKIKINYEQKDVEGAINEYENLLPSIGTLKSVLKAYTDGENSALKDKILTLYNELSGNFKDRFSNINSLLAAKSSKDELYTYYVKVVLLYFFEICLIGKKV
jgi:hypothetical protein